MMRIHARFCRLRYMATCATTDESRKQTMTQPIDNNPGNQQAREWSAQLGAMAAQAPMNPLGLPTHLAALIEHVRQRHRQRIREDVEHKVRAHHFIMAD
jgi:hypothetical protein